MSEHAYLSPSSAHRWMHCNGSARMEKGREERSAASEEGTLAHAICADVLEGVVDLENADASDEMKRNCSKYIDAIEEASVSSMGEILDRHIEVRLPIHHITGEPGAHGTADCVLFSKEELQIHDLKYGFVPVSAEDNEQLMIYALGAIELFELKPDIVKLVIHQPRINNLSEQTLSYGKLMEFAQRVKEESYKALTARYGEFLSPSEKACRFCKARDVCPALEREVENALGINLNEIETIEDLEKDRDLGFYKSKISLIKSWVDAKEAEIDEAALRGVKIKGYKLVAGKALARRFISPEETVSFLKRRRVPEKLYTEKKLLSPAKMQKALAKKPAVWSALQEQIEAPQGKVLLVPEDDKREELNYYEV